MIGLPLSLFSGQWSARTEGAYRSAFGGISRFRLVEAYRYRIYSVISLCKADIVAVSEVGQSNNQEKTKQHTENAKNHLIFGFFCFTMEVPIL